MLKRAIPWMVLLPLVFAYGALAQGDAEPLVTESGRPIGLPATATIGPEGGEVRSPDGALTVTFPPGALAAETEVGVQSISNHAPLGLGGGYRLTPEGVDFAEPVTLTFAYDDGVLAGQPAELLWFISQNASGSWSPQRSSVVDTEAKTVTVSVRHFSDWAVGRFIDLKLEPAQSLVSPGESVVLGITGFIYDPDRDEGVELVPLDDALVALTEGRQLLDSTERYVGFQVRNWRLNGQDAPGNEVHGSLDPLERKALYTAPSTAPDPNTVAVSVDLRATNRDDSWHQYTLVANITIHTAEYYLTLSGLDETLLFVGGRRSAVGAQERVAADALVQGSRLVVGSVSNVDHAAIDFIADGATPGAYPAPPIIEGVTVTYQPKDFDGSEDTYLYTNYYMAMEMYDPPGVCGPAGDALRQGPFTVTIDRFETNEESGIEVVYGSYSGTLYADAVIEWFEQCVTPPSRWAAVSGTFKLPVLRMDGPPPEERSEDEPADDEPFEFEDEDLVPLAPLG